MDTKNIFLVIVVIIILSGILIYNNFSDKIYKIQKINPDNYEEVEEGFVSKELCNNDSYCKEKFNGNWECTIKDREERCICLITDEDNKVCGKDGKTYRNPSETSCLGVEIDYNGECKKVIEQEPIENGKKCNRDSDCPQGSRIDQICVRGECLPTHAIIPTVECEELRAKFVKENLKINYCSSDDECAFSGSIAPDINCCGIYYNKNSDTSVLVSLNQKYRNDCLDCPQGSIICGKAVCTCPDVTNLQLKCINNKCGHKIK